MAFLIVACNDQKYETTYYIHRGKNSNSDPVFTTDSYEKAQAWLEKNGAIPTIVDPAGHRFDSLKCKMEFEASKK